MLQVLIILYFLRTKFSFIFIIHPFVWVTFNIHHLHLIMINFQIYWFVDFRFTSFMKLFNEVVWIFCFIFNSQVSLRFRFFFTMFMREDFVIIGLGSNDQVRRCLKDLLIVALHYPMYPRLYGFYELLSYKSELLIFYLCEFLIA